MRGRPDDSAQPVAEAEAIVLKKQRILRRIRCRCIARIAAVALAAIITFTCILGVCRVQTTEMLPALHAGDIIVYLRPGTPVSTDVVLYEGNDPNSKNNTEQIPADDSGLAAGKYRIGRIQKTQGLPEAMRDDGIPVLQEPFPEDRIKGRVILLIRRRPL